MTDQNWTATRKLAITILGLRAALDKQDTGEPINIVAHSQGTLITIAALKMLKDSGYKPEDIRVNTLVMMGSPLDKEDTENAKHQNHNYVVAAASMIQGSMDFYWSSGDKAVIIKGGIGHYGLSTGGFTSKNIRSMEQKNVAHFGKGGWWDSSWITAGSVDLSSLISKSKTRIDPTHAGLVSVKTSALEWAGTADPVWFEHKHGKFDVPKK